MNDKFHCELHEKYFAKYSSGLFSTGKTVYEIFDGRLAIMQTALNIES